jgi:pilus assembly protein Flp/PilA
MLSHLVRALAFRDGADRGATAVEYGLLVTLVAVALVGVLFLVGGDLDALLGGPAEPAGPDRR